MHEVRNLEVIGRIEGPGSNVVHEPKELRRAAVAAGEQWTYTPLMVFGRPVDSTVRVDVAFAGNRSAATTR